MAATRRNQEVSVFLSIACFIVFQGIVLCDRKLTTVYNPGCNITQCKPNYQDNALNIAYTRAEGENDTLHYLISSIGVPAVLVLKTEPGTGDVVEIDWEKLALENPTESIAGAIKINQPVQFSFAVAFTKLYEYNDAGDTAMMVFDQNDTHGFTHQFNQFVWDGIADQQNMTKKNMVTLRSSLSMDNSTSFLNGSSSISFQFAVFDKAGRFLEALPHLLYNENITQMDFIIDHLKPMYMKSRFGLEVVVVSTDGQKNVPSEFDTKQSIDDEYTPGVFKLTNWATNKVKTINEGFIQWKPVCYLDAGRTRNNATYVRTYSIKSAETDRSMAVQDLEKSILFAYYGDKLNNSVLGLTMANVSFGLSKDGWYTGSNYTAWTTNIGYGIPPLDTISVLVIAIISAGLGLPVIIIIFGGIFVCVKKRSKVASQGPGYSSVN